MIIKQNSIAPKIGFFVVATLIALTGVVFVYITNQFNAITSNLLKGDIIQSSNLIHKSIAYPMFEGETEAVTAIIENAGEEESILYLALLDKTMTPVAEGGQLNEDYLPSSEIISSVKNDLKSVYTNTFFDDGHVTYFMPIIIEEACLECHDEMKVGDFQGAVQVTLQTIAIVKAQKNNAIIMWLSSIGIIVIVSGVLLIIMQIIVIKPLQKTIVSMKDIAQGEGIRL